MGTPKQLLRYRGETLVRRAAAAAIDAGGNPVIVVTGCSAEAAEKELAGLQVLVARNPAWESGMGSSIRAGIRELLGVAPDVSGVMITLCDQPGVGTETLLKHIQRWRDSEKGICVADFGGELGPPVVFAREHFGELLAIEPSGGAKQVIYAHCEEALRVDCPEARCDLDTVDEYSRLLNEERRGHGH